MIYISQSLIKKMLSHGNVIDHCPAYIYWVMLLHKYEEEPTDNMKLGRLFEHKALLMPGRAPAILKDARTGNPSVKVDRILTQVEMFKEDCKNLEIAIDLRFC